MQFRAVAELRAAPLFFPLVAANLLSGLADAISGAYIALFAVTRIHLDPLGLSEFLTCAALSGIVMNAALGAWLDRSRTPFPVFLALGGKAVGYAALAFTSSFHVLLLLALLPLGMSAAAFAQLFALARQHLDGADPITAARGTAIVRAIWSLAWSVGPAFGAAVIGVYDFPGVFLLSGVCGLIALAIVAGIGARPPHPTPSTMSRVARRVGARAALASLALTLFHTGLFMGSVALPIVVTTVLKGTKTDVGLAFSTCALLEVFVMAVFVWRPPARVSTPVLGLGFVAFVFYFVALSVAGSVGVVIGAQALRAVAIGIVSYLGISFLQAIMPNRAATATALFSNTAQVGSVMSALCVGGVAHAFGYAAIFPLGAVLSAAGWLLVCCIKR